MAIDEFASLLTRALTVWKAKKSQGTRNHFSHTVALVQLTLLHPEIVSPFTLSIALMSPPRSSALYSRSSRVRSTLSSFLSRFGLVTPFLCLLAPSFSIFYPPCFAYRCIFNPPRRHIPKELRGKFRNTSFPYWTEGIHLERETDRNSEEKRERYGKQKSATFRAVAR